FYDSPLYRARLPSPSGSLVVRTIFPSSVLQGVIGFSHQPYPRRRISPNLQHLIMPPIIHPLTLLQRTFAWKPHQLFVHLHLLLYTRIMRITHFFTSALALTGLVAARPSLERV